MLSTCWALAAGANTSKASTSQTIFLNTLQPPLDLGWFMHHAGWQWTSACEIRLWIPLLFSPESKLADHADGDHHRQNQRGERVDLGSHAKAHHRVDLHGQGRRTDARGEKGDDEVIQRQGQRDQKARQDAWRNQRKREIGRAHV